MKEMRRRDAQEGEHTLVFVRNGDEASDCMIERA